MTTENNTLTIRLSSDGFFISERFYEVAPGADFDQRLMDIMLDSQVVERIHEERIRKVICIVETSRFSLSPITLSEAVAEEMFRLTNASSSLPEHVLLHTADTSLQVRITYALSASLYHFMQRTFGEVTFLLDAMLLLQEHRFDHGLLAHTTPRAVTLIAYRDRRLQLCNRIETTGATNQTYFILSTWKQMDFNALEDTLFLHTEDPDLTENLKKYIKCVS